MSPWPSKTCNFIGLIRLCCILTGLFWDAVDSFAGLFDWFYYIFTGERTSKADKFDNLHLMKILNTPLSQKSPEIRNKRPKQEQNLQTKKGAISRPWRMNPFSSAWQRLSWGFTTRKRTWKKETHRHTVCVSHNACPPHLTVTVPQPESTLMSYTSMHRDSYHIQTEMIYETSFSICTFVYSACPEFCAFLRR